MVDGNHFCRWNTPMTMLMKKAPVQVLKGNHHCVLSVPHSYSNKVVHCSVIFLHGSSSPVLLLLLLLLKQHRDIETTRLIAVSILNLLYVEGVVRVREIFAILVQRIVILGFRETSWFNAKTFVKQRSESIDKGILLVCGCVGCVLVDHEWKGCVEIRMLRF